MKYSLAILLIAVVVAGCNKSETVSRLDQLDASIKAQDKVDNPYERASRQGEPPTGPTEGTETNSQASITGEPDEMAGDPTMGSENSPAVKMAQAFSNTTEPKMEKMDEDIPATTTQHAMPEMGDNNINGADSLRTDYEKSDVMAADPAQGTVPNNASALATGYLKQASGGGKDKQSPENIGMGTDIEMSADGQPTENMGYDLGAGPGGPGGPGAGDGETGPRSPRGRGQSALARRNQRLREQRAAKNRSRSSAGLARRRDGKAPANISQSAVKAEAAAKAQKKANESQDGQPTNKSNVEIILAKGQALPIATTEGTAMAFSVDYQFRRGAPQNNLTFYWAITNSKGTLARQVKLQGSGTLKIAVPKFRPDSGPFKTSVWVEDRGKNRYQVSKTINFPARKP